MYISAKIDYAIRALCGLAHSEQAVTSAALAASQSLPEKFLESILNDLRRVDLVVSRRGPDGGYLLSRPASEIRLADVIRPLEGPLAEVRGLRPEAATYDGAAESLQTVWVAVRASLRSVLETTTIADIVNGRLPTTARALAADPDSWVSRPARY
jgi:Rrf2 family protein